MKYGLLFLISLFSLALSAQLVTQKNGKYGITDITTGDLLVEQKYDSIYQLRLRPLLVYSQQDPQLLPLFVCISKKQLQLFNSNTASFLNGTFDEIKLYRQLDEETNGFNPPKYIPHFVDCFMLRKGSYWGFISYTKEYSFRDRVEKTDVFNLIEPQYQELKFVEEVYGYDSQKYTRLRRILAAKKDTLWGAIKFETGEVLVPFAYKLPIHKFRNSYNRHNGIEFLSTEGGFIPYYIARKTWSSTPQVIINPQHPDIYFEFDFVPDINIYYEFSAQYLYIEPEKDQEGFFKLFDFNSGKLLFSYERDLRYKYFQTHRYLENVLRIEEYTPSENLSRYTWFNLTTGKEILYLEGKSYKDRDFSLSQPDLIVLKGGKPVGKIVGEGAAMKIEWTTKKQYTREAIKK